MISIHLNKWWREVGIAVGHNTYYLYVSSSITFLRCTDGDLTELFKDEFGEEAPLPEDQSLYYLQQILRGVNFLHQNGFLHLDIKGTCSHFV